MRKPYESLDDFIVKATPENVDPPRPVSLRLTGEVEVLKPLARWEHPGQIAPTKAEIQLRPVPHRFSWFHRSLLVGGGITMTALVFTSAILIGVSDSAVPPETANVEFIEVPNEAERLLPEEAPLSSDIFSTSESGEETGPVRTPVRRANRNRFRRAAAPVRTTVRKALPRPAKQPHQLLVSKFVPTTLVIYIENGLIKSRIEPWLADRK